jgi:predicted anti-sigma-YlaC factor YlaD
MKHQQFENWILLEEDLDRNQQRELHLHLKGCSQCQSLYQSIHQLDHLFRTAPEPAPAADFSARWMNRIQKVERRRDRLILGSTLGLISLATIFLLSIVGLEMRLVADYFPQMLLQLVTTIAEWLVFLGQLSDILTPLVRVGTKMITPLWLYFLAFSLGGGAVIWILNSIRLRTLQKEINS